MEINHHSQYMVICYENGKKTLNNSPSPHDSAGRNPEQIFSKTNVNINAMHYKPFGYLFYVLDASLQQNSPYHKWKDRGKIGIYMGKYPHHGRNISLVLSITTGLVSPQFHITYDPSFDAVQQESFKSNLQAKARFVTRRE